MPGPWLIQVHISEARVATALDKLAYMEELVNDRLLQDRNQAEPDQESPSPSTSTQSLDTVKRKSPRKNLNVSGPVQPYHPRLKNFWYPVAFSTDLKDDTMVSYYFQLWFTLYVWNTIMERNSSAFAHKKHFYCYSSAHILLWKGREGAAPVKHLWFQWLVIVFLFLCHFSVSDSNWLFRGTMGSLSWQRWETRMCSKHLCT
jgi:hypothetical protein